MKIRICSLIIIPLLLLLLSCGTYLASEMATPAMEAEKAYAEEPAPSAVGGAAPASPAARDTAVMLAKEPVSETTAAEPAPTVGRKRIYSGYCRLLVNEAERTKTVIADIAEESGGYVESVYETAIIIRVPAELFEEIFAGILDLGDTDAKSVETYDVTEYFRDLATRLRLHEKTRERLYVLLDKTTDVEERLKILREIKRLTEEIERINRTLDLLERQIAFSRITVDLIPRLPQTQLDKSGIPFRWMARLDPLYPSLPAPAKELTIELGDDYAVFEKEARFRAETAEGTRVRIGAAANNPKGDTEFWRKALAYHLSPYYRDTEILELGAFQAVLFTSKDAKPYSYLVAVAAEKEQAAADQILVVEVFFPAAQALDARLDELTEAVGEVELP
jgi:hypothetical protein